MSLDVLRGELERLFELDQLHELARKLLGLDPDRWDGGSTKVPFVARLVDRCVETDSVEALCDALLASREGVDPRVLALQRAGYVSAESVEVGQSLGPYKLEERLGEGSLSVVYTARRGSARLRLKLLRHSVALHRAPVQRFFAVSRLVGSLGHPGLPQAVVAGSAGDRLALVHDYVDAQPLSSRLAAHEPQKIRDVWPLLKQLLEALKAIHSRRVAHGNLRPSNVLVVRVGKRAEKVRLLDAGAHFLRASRIPAGTGERGVGFVGPGYAAPEQIRGGHPAPSADVYSFAALLYELLSGQPPFGGTEVEALVGHLHRDPDPLSFVVPHGWVSPDLDEFLLAMLDKDPQRRPPDAEAVLDVLETLAGYSVRHDTSFPEEEFNRRISRLIEHPADQVAAGVLEAAIDQGASAVQVAETFRLAAEELGDDSAGKAARKRLLTRSAALYETVVNNPDAAAQTYRLLLQLDPGDAGARAALERIYRGQGKYEELVDLLVEQAQHDSSAAERARAFVKMGHLFVTRLGDPEQALVAFTQAFCETPSEPGIAAEIERLAGARPEAWQEVLTGCGDAVSGEMPSERKVSVLERLGHWYTQKLARPDLAVQCLQSLLVLEPAHDGALSQLASIYRRAQQWKELSRTLARWSNAAVTPQRARDLRAEAAQIFEERLHQTGSAAQLYEQVLDEDPAHEQAGQALARLYEREQDFTGLARVLKQRSNVLTGERRQQLLCRLAEVCERQLDDPDRARQVYEEVIVDEPGNLDALAGLERIHASAGRHSALLANLEQQLRFAVTPNQKLALLQRIARVHQDEFHDRDEAVAALERILDVDPGHLETLQRLEEQYGAMQRWADLAHVLERHAEALGDDPQRVEKLLLAARVHADRLGDAEGAIRYCEAALAIDPKHRATLDTLVRLRSTIGDDERAVEAIEALADGASPDSRSEHLLRAAQLMEKRGDLERLIQWGKQALEANPDDFEAASTLRAAYVKRGAVEVAVEMLERQVGRATATSVKAKLCIELARLLFEQLHDVGRAEAAAARALDLDPTSLEARALAGDIAYEAERYQEALEHYAQPMRQLEQFEPADVARRVRRHLEALVRIGSKERALEEADRFLQDSPPRLELLRQISEFHVAHGPPTRARELAAQFVLRYSSDISDQEHAEALRQLGEAARRQEDYEVAISSFEQAAALDGESVRALRSLAQVYEALEDWAELVDTLRQQLERVSGEQRAGLLIQIGELAEGKLRDPDAAAKSYLAALAERPDDRKILLQLLRLYSEEKDWAKLVDVVTKLADAAAEPAQKAKYLHTAARVAAHELDDRARALQLADRALAADSESDGVVEEAIELRRELEDDEGLRSLLEQQIHSASAVQNRDRALRYAEELADLHLSHLRVDEAISVYEAAQRLDPMNPQRQEVLADLYASDPAHYLERALRSQHQLLDQDPYRPEPYRLLHRIYSEIKNEDAVWCVSQVLSVLHRAAPEEEVFYKRHRRAEGVATRMRISDADWAQLVAHPDASPLLTNIYQLIQPAITATRTSSLEEFGYDPRQALDPAQYPHGLVRALRHAAAVLRIRLPLLFSDPEVAGVSMPRTQPPCLVLGPAAMNPGVSPSRAAFVAATHLTSFRLGPHVRFLVPTAVGLKAWMLAAIKLIAPRLPVAAELEGPTMDAHAVLKERVTGQLLDRLAQPVYKMLQEGAQLDVGRWMAGVDYTSDRVGLVLSDDLRTALEVLEATGDAAGAPTAAERTRALLRYLVSSEYLEL
jgi:tetratricopeptide (TPR) repeat protein/serine/threonine protein kinase